MKIKCPLCGFDAFKYGKTSAGKQRWKCKECNATFTLKIDNSTKQFKVFLDWLFGKKAHKEMPGAGRTFRRNTSQFWKIWALPPKIETPRRVVFIDGIYLASNLCVLICCDTKHVLGWYVCRFECSRAWEALMSRIAMPDVVVSDGGTGFARALKNVWPQTEHQRCLIHVFNQVKRYTTKSPQTLAGRELYDLARVLLRIKNTDQATHWALLFNKWIQRHKAFLAEMTIDEAGNKRPTHERLVKAKNALVRLLKEGTLFTYLEAVDVEMPLPSTNNRIEGGVNAQLRDLIHRHRGLSAERRLKAVYWWCYFHSPKPLSLTKILKYMPTDATITNFYEDMHRRAQVDRSIPTWGDAVVWSDLHHSTPYQFYWD